MSYLNPSKAEVRRHRLLVGGASLLLTTIVMTGFLLESRSGYSKPDPKLVFMQNWSGDRSRADTIADTAATTAVHQQMLGDARKYIATLSGEARTKAQAQYDAYVERGGAQKEVPYVSAAARAAAPLVTIPTGRATADSVPTEPPVL
ncbi:hypothetical protein GCM10011529_17100 [Polymorphobacter glacialis]|uniref:Uncharacterized protein n=1 Tax=Sandarakinorhabdus glacialis TaxID=1614636 RepID=A0A916ZS15_9SPHN|nr:hypothetical protein [Polymorphobacter glacialis]GGE11377.1 hypothetical protein GCM10011529_17100 [Polymorphobacter glacialis]